VRDYWLQCASIGDLQEMKSMDQHWKFLQLFTLQGCRWGKSALTVAALNGHKNVVRWYLGLFLKEMESRYVAVSRLISQCSTYQNYHNAVPRGLVVAARSGATATTARTIELRCAKEQSDPGFALPASIDEKCGITSDQYKYAHWGGWAASLSECDDAVALRHTAPSVHRLLSALDRLDAAQNDVADAYAACNFSRDDINMLNSPLLDGLVVAVECLSADGSISIAVTPDGMAFDARQQQAWPIHYAACRTLTPHARCFEMALAVACANVDYPDAMHYLLNRCPHCGQDELLATAAIIHGHHRTLAVLHQHHAAMPVRNRHRLLYYAIFLGQTDMVASLLKMGWDPNDPAFDAPTVHQHAWYDKQPTDHMPPLHLAVWLGHVDMVRLLLDAGALVDAKMQRGKLRLSTPLMFAARQDCLEIAELLVSREADVTARVSGADVLSIAYEFDAVQVVTWLLSSKLVRREPLMLAARFGSIKCLRAHLAAGPCSDDTAGPALLLACHHGMLRVTAARARICSACCGRMLCKR